MGLKVYENFLIYDTTYKTLLQNLGILNLFEVDRFIRVYDGIRCLTLFGSEKYGAIYNRIIDLISQESGITYVFCHNHAKIKVDHVILYL